MHPHDILLAPPHATEPKSATDDDDNKDSNNNKKNNKIYGKQQIGLKMWARLFCYFK